MFVSYALFVFLAAIAGTAKASTVDGCPPLQSGTLHFACALGGAAVDCSAAVPVGTVAILSCRPGFKPPETYTGISTSHCNRRKRWSLRLFDCVPDCGRRKGDGAMQLSVGGHEAETSEFPWHVAIFLKHGVSFMAVCGGTLVTPRFVVSAAHCFWDESYRKKMDLTKYRVAAGKHTAAWNTTDLDEERFTIKTLHLPEKFLGRARKLDADIAVMQLSAAVTLSVHVNIVCMDWSNAFEFQQLSPGVIGTVPGWGRTESDRPSKTLRYVDLPYVSYTECHTSVPFDYQPFIIADKICAGYTNRTTSVCQGDSGGGLVFPARDLQGHRRYFLRAVVSSQPGVPGEVGIKCSGNFFSAFTRVSNYRQWIQGIVFAPQDEFDDDSEDDVMPTTTEREMVQGSSTTRPRRPNPKPSTVPTSATPDAIFRCSGNLDCATSFACIQGICRDPCPGACGVGAKCEVQNHTPVCSCPEGSQGDPFTRCTMIQEEVIRSRCSGNLDCATSFACSEGIRQDPCPGACGVGAKCEVQNHTPVCSCPEGSQGDPFTRCQMIQDQDPEGDLMPTTEVEDLSVPTPATPVRGCPALTSNTLVLNCTLAGEIVDCSDTVPVWTVANFSCRPGLNLPVTFNGSRSAHCNQKQRWSRPLFDCVPTNGRSAACRGNLDCPGRQQCFKGTCLGPV